LSPQQRGEIVNELKNYFAEVDAARMPLTDSEMEQAIIEAMQSRRPSYRPRR